MRVGRAGPDFDPVPGKVPPVTNDLVHPFADNNNGSGKQPTYRIADLSNPNLKPWVKAQMKRDNDEVLAGKIAFTARQSCMPAGVQTEDGKGLEVVFQVDDPDAFYQPWWDKRRYRRVQEPMLEDVCAENNEHLFDYHIPVADQPDFWAVKPRDIRRRVDLPSPHGMVRPCHRGDAGMGRVSNRAPPCPTNQSQPLRRWASILGKNSFHAVGLD